MKKDYTKTKEGSYKSNSHGDPSTIYLEDYWSTPIRSTIDEQVYNVKDKSELVKKELTKIYPKSYLEIGCAPAYLLGEMSEIGKARGIEVDPKYKEQLQKYSKDAELEFGFFPEISKDWNDAQFSNIVALDVFEHIEDGNAFLKECNRLLVKGGVLVLQCPIILEDGKTEELMFNTKEHVWYYELEHLKEMLVDNGFKIKNVGRFIVGHEQISAKKI
jgi:2-polyprenyl-3-methyl-5-hydroxy-6-metoxy-1,4-benzoquinol methylase